MAAFHIFRAMVPQGVKRRTIGHCLIPYQYTGKYIAVKRYAYRLGTYASV